MDRMLKEDGVWTDDPEVIKKVLKEKWGNIVKKQPEFVHDAGYKGRDVPIERYITVSRVRTLIQKLDPNKASGPTLKGFETGALITHY